MNDALHPKNPTVIPNHFIDVLEAQAQRRPGQTAIDFLGNGRDISATVSFAALHVRAVELGARLQARYPAQSRVVLMLPTGMDYVGAFCACQCAGMIAVPLFAPQSRRPRHVDRVRNIVQDASPALIVTTLAAQPVLRELVASLGIETDIHTLAELGATAPASPWERPLSNPNAISFLQYTSGSTGTPKGVVVRQRNLMANLELMRTAAGFGPGDCMVSWLPLYHDMGLIGALLAPIYIGMRCVLMETKSFVQSPSVWLQAISRYRGTASFAPNSAYELCITAIDDATVGQLDLSCWKHAICGAEPVHAATLAAFSTRFAPAGLRQQALSPGYGQAEATLCVSTVPECDMALTLRLDKSALQNGLVRLAPEGDDAAVFVSCGAPQPGHRVAIVDPATFEHCAPGAIGEIWLHGPSNADAYWNQPDISDLTFRARACGDDSSYLRSGDLGFMHEGQLVVCGRLKDLIILNGRNVYPHDIEFAITQATPAIRSGRIAAFSVPDPRTGRERLVIVAEPHRRCSSVQAQQALFASVREAVAEAADCAVDEIVLIAAATISMTTSGKISRSGARRQYLDGALEIVATSGGVLQTPAAGDALPGCGPLLSSSASREALLASCVHWIGGQIALLRPGLVASPHASLIALGLDSLAIAALRGRIEALTGWQAPFEAMFGGATIDTLAAGMLTHLDSGRPLPQALEPHPVDLPCRLSHAQRRLWFINRLDPHSCAHNIAVRVSLRGAPNFAALERSLSAIAERHPILRTAYRDSAEGTVQMALAREPQLAHLDLTRLSDGGQAARIEALMQQERTTPFDLAAGCVLRVTLAHCASEQHELIIGVHHIAFDGRSADIFVEELDRLYTAYSAGGTPAASAPLGYAAFAQWEHARLGSGMADAQVQFWRGYLAGMPATLALPRQAGAASGEHRFTIDAIRLAALEEHCRAHDMTVFMALLTLYGVVLRYLSGQTRIIIGTDVAGRAHPQLDDVIGFFVNQLPLRCDLEDDLPLDRLMARVATAAQNAYAHQELPFDLLVSALAPERCGRQSPLFQAKLNWQPQRATTSSIGALRIAGVSQQQNSGDFAVVLDLTSGCAGVDAHLKYQGAYFDADAAARFANLWSCLIDDFGRLLRQPLSSLIALLRARDTAMRMAAQAQHAAQGRSQLGAVRRRAPQT